jgi:hypothetical protein
MEIQDLVGKFVSVVVSVNGKSASMELKVCKANSRSVLFIEIDKPNRKNIFRKVSPKDIEKVDDTFVKMKDGVVLSQNKWESDWDSIGQTSQMTVTQRITPVYSKRSNGWAHRLKSNSQYNYGGGAHFRT